MRRYAIPLVAALCMASCSAPSDLEEQVRLMREQGRTDAATYELQTTARYTSGETIFSVRPTEDGGFAQYWAPSFCPKPGTSREEIRRMEEKIEERVEREAERLQEYADMNSSGFVTTAEAKYFASTVALGYKVRGFQEHEVSPEKIAQSLNISLSELNEGIERYNLLAESMSSSEISVDPVDF